MTARVLVVDDDATVGEVVRSYLTHAGFEVEQAADGPTALAVAARTRPDLVVLDLMLPGRRGLEVCERLRWTRPDVAVVMLTALGEESDRLVGPGDRRRRLPRQTLQAARARPARAVGPAAQRRPPGGGRAAPAAGLRGRRGRRPRPRADVGGRPVPLTTREFDLLVLLMTHPGRAYTRNQLMQEVWGWEFGDHLDGHRPRAAAAREGRGRTRRSPTADDGVGRRLPLGGRVSRADLDVSRASPRLRRARWRWSGVVVRLAAGGRCAAAARLGRRGQRPVGGRRRRRHRAGDVHLRSRPRRRAAGERGRRRRRPRSPR